ncbi:MAG TPA: metalloregulator ArsR/SmtB family transcription factor [Streptosporangiaceae bacterium]|jgi:ArsR family transcriptional regulator
MVASAGPGSADLDTRSRRDDFICCAPLSSRISAAEAGAAAARFAAMGHPRRIHLMSMLVRSGFPVCVCDLVAVTGWAQSTVSHHLKQLVDVGLLRREQRGKWAYYSVDHAGLASLATVVSVPPGEFELAGRRSRLGE